MKVEIQNSIYNIWFSIKNKNTNTLLFIIYLKEKETQKIIQNVEVSEGSFQIPSFSSTHSEKKSLSVLTNTFWNIYHIGLYI